MNLQDFKRYLAGPTQEAMQEMNTKIWSGFTRPQVLTLYQVLSNSEGSPKKVVE